jgi:Signal transduction histidine kinase
MKLFEYIKSTLPQISCQLTIILIINAVLASSTNLKKSQQDIIYLDILLGIVFFSFFFYDFIRSRSRYRKLTQALDENKSIDYLLPDDDRFHSEILRKAIRLKDSEATDLISSYKDSIDELSNYITKWVHEIKIPISVTELLLENNNGLDIETSRKFKTELERIKFLVNQVLYAGRASHYQEDLNISEINLQKAVRDALKPNYYFLMAKNLEVIPDNLNFNVVNDEKWVVYILEQILNNASKYVRQNGKIEIFADEDDKSVYLHIKDNGIGIPPTDINRIFDKGFTGQNGRKTSKSTGMGMYYSKKVADKIGVGLKVTSRLGEFTEFVLVFYKISDYLNVTKI